MLNNDQSGVISMLSSKVYRLSWALACCGLFVCQTTWAAKPPQFVAPAMQTHTIASKYVDQTFEIYVQVPWSLADGSERFPVLYLTDSYGGMSFADTTSIMQLGGATCPDL